MGKRARQVLVGVRLPALTLAQLDEIAAARGVSRSQQIREAIGWTIAKESEWMLQRTRARLARERREAEEAAALERIRQEHPDRFDQLPGRGAEAAHAARDREDAGSTPGAPTQEPAG